MTGIERYAYSNRWSRVHPAEKIIFALTTLVISLLSGSFSVPCAVLCLTGICIVVLAEIPLRFYLKLLLIPAGFLLAGTAAVACGLSAQPAGFVLSVHSSGMHFGITTAGLTQAGLLFMHSLSALSCLYLVIITTPVERVTSALERAGIPKILIEMMVLMYRFIFIIRDNAAAIHTAQAARLGHVDWRTGMRSMGTLAARLLVRSLHRSQAMSWALMSRGYTGSLSFFQQELRHSAGHIIFFISCDIMLIAMLVLQ